jgi:predicted nucleic acid-binding protein
MVEGGLLDAVRSASSVPVYVHTVNDASTAACLLAAGATGLYSDDLSAEDVNALRGVSGECS